MQTPDEGYIKFNYSWEEAALPARISIEEINLYRKRLHQLGLIGVYENGVGFGNISMRLESNYFLITGSATGHLPALEREHFAIVEHFDIEKNYVRCKGLTRASSESMSHAVIYQEQPEVGSIIHGHHQALWQKLLTKYPSTSKSVPYGTPEMAKEIIALIRQGGHPVSGIFAMAGHSQGIIAYAGNFESCLKLILEEL